MKWNVQVVKKQTWYKLLRRRQTPDPTRFRFVLACLKPETEGTLLDHTFVLDLHNTCIAFRHFDLVCIFLDYRRKSGYCPLQSGDSHG